MQFGCLHGRKQNMVFVGGDCSLQGFDQSGTEQFWTVVGGSATSMMFADVDRDGKDELIVGSDDFEIRAFQNEQSLFEVTETESISHLCPVRTSSGSTDSNLASRFAYGLSNGTIGVYDGKIRVWRVKAKDTVQTMAAYDLDGDGVDEVISGWSNGKLEARRNEDGQVLYRETLASSVSALLTGDYRGTGADELICCTLDGEVRGYDGSKHEFVAGSSMGENVADFGPLDTLMKDENSGDDILRALQGANIAEQDKGDALLPEHALAQDKPQVSLRNLNNKVGPHNAELAMLQEQLTLKTMELRSLEKNLTNAKSGSIDDAVGAIPDDTHVDVELIQKAKEKCLHLNVKVSEGCVVRNVVVFSLDAGLFDGECVIGASTDSGSNGRLVVPLCPLKNIPTTLRVQALVAARGSSEYLHIFECEQPMCRFSMFAPTKSPNEDIGNAAFILKRVNLAAVEDILRSLFPHEAVTNQCKPSKSGSLEMHFFHLNDGSLISIHAAEDETGVRMKVEGSTLDIVAEFVQAIASLLEVKQVEACLDFPSVLHRLEALMQRVDELQSLRQRLHAEMADESTYIKNGIVRAEDARVLQDVTNLTAVYSDLTAVNMQLIGEYTKRSNNQAELLAALREVNQIIQRASLVRVGPPQKAVVTACRKAIKSHSIPALFHAITSMSIS